MYVGSLFQALWGKCSANFVATSFTIFFECFSAFMIRMLARSLATSLDSFFMKYLTAGQVKMTPTRAIPMPKNSDGSGIRSSGYFGIWKSI